jgi:hypothetical protein
MAEDIKNALSARPAINLAGVSALGDYVEIEEGYYKPAITEVYEKPGKSDIIFFTLTWSEGEYKGQTRMLTLNLKDEKKPERVAQRIRTYLEAAGYSAAELESGPVNYSNPSVWLNRPMCIYFAPGEPNARINDKGEKVRGYDQVDALTPKVWMAGKENNTSRRRATSGSNGAGAMQEQQTAASIANAMAGGGLGGGLGGGGLGGQTGASLGGNGAATLGSLIR